MRGAFSMAACAAVGVLADRGQSATAQTAPRRHSCAAGAGRRRPIRWRRSAATILCESKTGEQQGLPGRHVGRRGPEEVHRPRRLPARQDLGLRRGGRVGGRRLQRRVPARASVAKEGAAAPPPAAPRRGSRRLRGSSPGETSNPASGFLVGRSSAGELAISGYALVRYVNQMPGEQTFTDHLGNERTVDGRNDIWPHRVMVFLKGWVGNPKLIYAVTFWTVLDTNQNAIFGNLGYQFSRKFSVYAGLNGNPGTRSLQGSHPFWLGHDRVMADEFFRPFFNSGVWAQGEPVHGPLVQRDAGRQQQHSRRQVDPARPDVHHRRARCGGCRRRRSSAPGAPTATGNGTRRWPPGSASPRRGAPSSASPTRRAVPTTRPSGWPTA